MTAFGMEYTASGVVTTAEEEAVKNEDHSGGERE